jgi:hypothetical protein
MKSEVFALAHLAELLVSWRGVVFEQPRPGGVNREHSRKASRPGARHDAVGRADLFLLLRQIRRGDLKKGIRNGFASEEVPPTWGKIFRTAPCERLASKS